MVHTPLATQVAALAAIVEENAQRLASLARAVAAVEDEVAETLSRMAQTRSGSRQGRLREQAKDAGAVAVRERQRAEHYQDLAAAQPTGTHPRPPQPGHRPRVTTRDPAPPRRP